MPRTCYCNDLDGCSRCRAYETHPAYAEWAVLSKGRNVVCRHRGAMTRHARFPTDAGKLELKVFACAVYGECTTTKPVPSVAGCCSGSQDGGCPDFQFQVPDPVFSAQPGDPAVGVVLGVYEWPALVELQIRLLRHTCGPVPILVSEDPSPTENGIAEVCAKYEGVHHWPNPDRIGHHGGDLTAFWKGIVWGKSLGLSTVAKLSHRFIPILPRWLQNGALALAASGLPLSGQTCRGRENFTLRTEAVLLDVIAWNRPAVLQALRPRRVRPHADTETLVWKALCDNLGGKIHPWALIGEDRYGYDPGVVWHCSHSEEDYRDLAMRFGLQLDSTFTTEGRHSDLDE